MPPGKLAPKLFQDLLAFDPIKGKPNVLTESPKPVGDGPQLAPLPASCKHDYTTKNGQCVSPPIDQRPDATTQYKIAVLCKKCRIHASVFVDYANCTCPCPTSDQPLHHFLRAPDYDRITPERIQYAWQCSLPACRANLFVSYRVPRLSLEDIRLLTDEELLRTRYDALFEYDSSREGIRPATRMEPLGRLRKYVRDALLPPPRRDSFPANNKRFQEAFGMNGQDCSELLHRLGFRYKSPDWKLPDPAPIEDRLRTEEHHPREMCEDVVYELLACMFQLASEVKELSNPASAEGWPSANRELERVLAAHDYPRHRRMPAASEEAPYFYGLGALPDFADNLVEYAYERQASVDPVQQSYYFECLQVITNSRSTEQLQTKVAMLQSTGLYSRRDLRAAYRFLSIPRPDVSDQHIIDLFHARQSDLGPEAQEEAREALFKIGVSRGSQMLQSAAQQSVDTYEDALIWLGNGVNKDTPDEALLAVVATKTAESSSSENIAQKAIATIARARKSNMLNHWLLTGRSDGFAMSVDEALRHLNIEQPFDAIDQTILPALFDSAKLDRPGDITDRAIATIEQALQGGLGGVPRSPETWPVGLTSHGNTCYLNSLLQYYFSIRTFRDIILSYDNYKLDTVTHPEKAERVGQRKISIVEIRGGQRFADDLKALFDRMIKSPNSAVRPEEDLVCRAFLDPKDYALMASSIPEETSEAAKQTTDTTSAVITEENMVDSTTVLESPAVEEQLHSDASSTTLQASNAGDDDRDVVMKIDEVPPPTPPKSPAPDAEAKTVAESASEDVPAKATENAPEHAPPLPPRRKFSTTKEKALAEAENRARQQQDVTEVHDGIMFRLRSGMIPRGTDDTGEQEDELRDIFNMDIIETTLNKGMPQKPKHLSDSSIQLNVPSEPTDIYSALDAIFDIQAYAGNSDLETFRTIGSLPPLLQVNIPRIGFDKDRGGGGAFKSTECVHLTDDLYLDRYCETHHEQLLPKRQECWEWRKQLRELQREKKVLSETPEGIDLDGPSAVTEAANYLTGLDAVNRDLQSVGVEPIEADGEITTALTTDGQQQAARLANLGGQIDDLQKKIGQQFEDNREVKYRLAAVFFHRGAAGHGHYWIYIRDFQNNMWRMYNDERVDEFTKLEDIFEAKTWEQGTPTYAVYVAADKTEMIQAVCRDPEKAPTPEWAPAPPLETDVLMGQNSDTSGQPSGGAIDPQLLQQQQGGKPVWDDTRQVDEANTNW